jgi:hypothetical protein
MYGDLMFTEPFYAASIEKAWNPLCVFVSQNYALICGDAGTPQTARRWRFVRPSGDSDLSAAENAGLPRPS